MENVKVKRTLKKQSDLSPSLPFHAPLANTGQMELVSVILSSAQLFWYFFANSSCLISMKISRLLRLLWKQNRRQHDGDETNNILNTAVILQVPPRGFAQGTFVLVEEGWPQKLVVSHCLVLSTWEPHKSKSPVFEVTGKQRVKFACIQPKQRRQ